MHAYEVYAHDVCPHEMCARKVLVTSHDTWPFKSLHASAYYPKEEQNVTISGVLGIPLVNLTGLRDSFRPFWA